jgi:hypothetical protein
MKQSSALPVAWIALRILIVVNWLGGAAILALLIATVVAEQWTFTALGITPESFIPKVIVGLRAIAAIGLIGVPLNHVILTRLLAMVETVRRGDPFVTANAGRLRAVAWALFALQIIGIVIGGIAKAVSTPAHPLRIDAGFSTAGWLAVLLTFILARVFEEGAAMRDDLEGTV